jgi:A/G-specific adenine glycosylase
LGRKSKSRPIASAGGNRASRLSTDGLDSDSAWIEAIRRKLVSWYREAHRPLPWREDRDPYRILVSEMMLVQTTVMAVIPYFERFLARFPDVAALARAEESEVVKAWEGLGYYRRARQLHAAAKAIVDEHGAKVPDDPEKVRALPGVGRYIAGAILSFAFDRPAPILEANTQRVLARWLAMREDLKTSAAQARLWEAAGRLVPEKDAGIFNQAFMELGALICAPRAPMCLVCPVAAECRARALGLQDSLPAVVPRSAPLVAKEAAAIVFRQGRVLIVKRGDGRLWEGFHEFPTVHVAGADPAGRAFEDGPVGLSEGVRRLTGVRSEVGLLAVALTYGVTKHRVRLEAFEATGLSEELIPGPGLGAAFWEIPEKLSSHAFSAAGRKLIEWVVNRSAASRIG